MDTLKATPWTWIFLAFALVDCSIRTPNLNNADTKEAPRVDRISVRDKWLIDSDGRVRIFHGINSVQKSFPWYDERLLNETRLQYFEKWGLNTVRLGMMWAGLEPSEGALNQTYMNIMQDIVKKLKKYGLYSLLDMHQDVISSAFDAYDGIPLWLVKKFPKPRNPYPWPLKKLMTWGEGYITEAVGETFQHLYKNTSGALDYMSNFWVNVAKVFRNETGVIGYEIINEPWAGDIFKDPELLVPGHAGEKNLLPVYDVINEAIRKVDNHTLLFYEPVTWGIYFNGNITGTGFSRVPGGEKYTNLSVLSYHYYCWILTDEDSHRPIPFFKKVLCADLMIPQAFKQVLTDIKKTGGSAFLTEFGGYNIDGLDTTPAQQDIRVMSHADTNFQSWMFWASDFFTNDGHIKWDTVKIFSRTYARAIAGIPTDMYYDIYTGFFTLSFDQNPAIKSPTEIFLPYFKYPNGPKISVTSGFSATFDQKTSIVSIKLVSNVLNGMVACRIVIEPK